MGRLIVIALALALVLAACGSTGQGSGQPADLPVSGAEVAEVRLVVAGQAEEGSMAGSERHLASSFGAYAEPAGTLTGPALEELVAAVADAEYIDTGNVVYDLANPDYEVVFLLDGEELARLGYYMQVGRWGEYGVPGRWLDERWRLLAITIELPRELTASS